MGGVCETHSMLPSTESALLVTWAAGSSMQSPNVPSPPPSGRMEDSFSGSLGIEWSRGLLPANELGSDRASCLPVGDSPGTLFPLAPVTGAVWEQTAEDLSRSY